MRIFKIIVLFFLSIIAIVFVSLFFYKQHLKPTYKGNLKLKSIYQKVTVFYDTIGVPHIYAENQHDAYLALGYVHAQDRLWQMELIRRISAGRLSEIFGKNKEKEDRAIINTDRFFLGLGIEDAAMKTIKSLDTTSQSYKLTKAYLNGVNQFIKKGSTPIEFKILGIEKENYTIKDIYNVFGYMSFSFAAAHKTDPLLSKIKEKLNPLYLNDLGIKIDTSTTLIPNYNLEEGIQSTIVASVDKIMNNLPIPPFIGSNAWIVGPKKTASGKVIFANDPHISFSQPSVWYQAHIVCPNYEMYGFNLALVPFPLLGHNRDFAYGLTMFENDDIDFYKEEINPKNPNQYLVNGQFIPFEIRKKTIKIKGGDEEKITIKVSKHGPIMNDFIPTIDKNQPIAMDWIYTKFNNKMLLSMYEISHATNMEAFKKGVSKIHAPGLNVMYADNQDNFAWFAAGKLYKHNSSLNTKFVLDGANGVDDSLTYLDFSKNPQSINPTWNYVYSANNQPDKIDGEYYAGYYLPEDRAKRIVDVLHNKQDITVTDMKTLINDVTSAVVPKLMKVILKEIDPKKLTDNELIAFKIFRNWNGSFDLNQVAPTIYEKFKYQFFKNTFNDELGEKGFNQFMNTTLAKRQFAKQILSTNSIWADDVKTLNFVETKKYTILKSFKETIRFLEKKHGTYINKWKWKNVHTVTYEHSIGDKLGFLGLHFNVGPFPTSGSGGVLNNQGFAYTGSGDYHVTSGPSTRRIIDFNSIENSIAILPTGQSGNIFSKHYKDQTQQYLDGKFFKMLINKEEIQKYDDKLVLMPSN